MARHFKLTADGGSRGNPGPAGFGAVVSENGQIIAEIYEFIGTATNNVAEYGGLIAGLKAIHDLDDQASVDVCMDSKLVVEQMSGRWQHLNAPGLSSAQESGLGVLEIEERVPASVFEELKAKGHQVVTLSPWGHGSSAQLMEVMADGTHAFGSDPRCEGQASGV